MSYFRNVKVLFLGLALAASLVVAQAEAAEIRLETRVDNAYDLGFAPIPLPDLNNYTAGVPVILQVDYHIVVDSVGPGERGFGNVGFSAVLGPGVADAAGGWQPNTSNTDSNGAFPGGTVPLFSTNADAGPSNSDLIGIFATIAGGISNPNASDARVKIGQDPIPPNPSLVGSIFVQWDGVTPSAVGAAGVIISPYNLDGTFGLATPSLSEPVLLLTGIPEPSTLVLGGMGLVGAMVAFRRRRMA